MEDQYQRFAEKSVALYEGGENEAEERYRRARMMEAASAIVQRLSRLANDTMLSRKDVEQRWLADLCQYNGVRTPAEMVRSKAEPLGSSEDAKSTGSTLFVNITRAKTNRTEGRLFDMLFPADERNWGIKPTPVPQLDTVAKRGMEEAQRAVDEANRLEANPEATSPDGMTAEEHLDVARDIAPQGVQAQKEKDEATKRSERMATQIDDDLVEANYTQKARDAIGWACKIGIGVLKGPVVLDGGRTAWMKQEDGSDVLQPSGEAARPTIEHVNPWNFFPDHSATSMEDAEYVFERHILAKRELRKMGRNLGFDEDALRDLLREENPGLGLGEDIQHLRDMRLLTGESADITGRYVVWEYHGALECTEIEKLLRAAGKDDRADDFKEEMDPHRDYRVIAYFCNNKLLKLSEYYPMESGDFIYSVFSLEKGIASILGAIGQVRKMRDAQEALNAAWRMMMDNARLAIGPQVLIDKAKVRPEDGNWNMYPGKVWVWDSHNSGGQQQVSPFQFFHVPMNQEAAAGIIALAKAFIDDETAMPSYIEGGASEERAPGAASTMGGMAMIFNSAGVDPRRMVKNWDDDVTDGMITRLYHWHMQFSDKQEIKGDMQVEARGVSVLLQRELQAPHLLAAATNMTVHPVLGPAMKPYDLTRLTFQAVGVNPSDVMIEREEYDAKMKAMAEQTQPEDPQWAVRERIAQLDAETRVKVAQMGLEAEMVQLAQSSELSITEIKAQLAQAEVKAGVDVETARIAADSSERKLAAEIAVEQRIAAEARAQGEQPPGSGGTISGGSAKE